MVGNITSGGTGKTPLIIYLANELKKNGYRPGIISRGYGSKAVKIFNFSSEIILGNFYRHLQIFTGHTVHS